MTRNLKNRYAAVCLSILVVLVAGCSPRPTSRPRHFDCGYRPSPWSAKRCPRITFLGRCERLPPVDCEHGTPRCQAIRSSREMLDEARRLCAAPAGLQRCVHRLVKALQTNPCLTTWDLKSRGLSHVLHYARRLQLPGCPPPKGGESKKPKHHAGLGPTRGTRAAKSCARRLFRDAKKAIIRREHRRAARRFQAAFTYWAHPSIWFNLAVIHAKMKKPAVAADYLERYRRATTGAPRAPTPSALKNLLHSLGVIRVDTPGYRGDCSKLLVVLNDRPAGVGSVRRVVRPGRHTVEIRRHGRILWRRTVFVGLGETRVVGPRRPVP